MSSRHLPLVHPFHYCVSSALHRTALLRQAKARKHVAATHWFCSQVRRNQARTRTETSWPRPRRSRRCSWERTGIKKQLNEAVMAAASLQSATKHMLFMCVCVCTWRWGSRGSIQLINTSLHLSDANCRVRPLPSSCLFFNLPQSPAPLQPRLHRKNGTPPTHTHKLSPHFSSSYSISKPLPLRNSPLGLDLRTTSTAF